MSVTNEPKDEIVQFVFFKTAGDIPVDLFQQSWIAAAEEFYARGVSKVIFSEKLALNGDLSPYRFISKNFWASLEAFNCSFPKGLPSPSSRGHVTVSQAGIFKLEHMVKADGSKVLLDSIYKAGFKVMTMIPLCDQSLPKETVLEYADFLVSLKGFETLGVYGLNRSSDPHKEWLYEWIIEAIFNSINTTPESVLKDLMNCPRANAKWEKSIHENYMQMVAS
ncbi:hypothetical protein pdam_00019004 [Pocillopora damicornis]|uniref:Uncharacterized protein n=1 Tax=Pocillopora damicornis TaxID=46731 RepID=A0A3M6U221_POCDA|nr:uncharacterized protein LOC113669928 [Pocillopora damicornis]RMX47574.1 hypothetical protein pdam_00019004 [Pocillopora damicornis]